jgi:hypothetical protein
MAKFNFMLVVGKCKMLVFYGHLVYFTATYLVYIMHIMVYWVYFVVIWYIFFLFWYAEPRKIWQPWLASICAMHEPMSSVRKWIWLLVWDEEGILAG